MIHALVGFCLVDLIWMCVIIPFWTSKSSTKYWEQLRGLHIFGIIFSVLELLVKVVMGYFLMTDFKAENNGDIKKLLTFNYEELLKNLTDLSLVSFHILFHVQMFLE